MLQVVPLPIETHCTFISTSVCILVDRWDGAVSCMCTHHVYTAEHHSEYCTSTYCIEISTAALGMLIQRLIDQVPLHEPLIYLAIQDSTQVSLVVSISADLVIQKMATKGTTSQHLALSEAEAFCMTWDYGLPIGPGLVALQKAY